MPTSPLNTRSILQSATALRLGVALLLATVFSGCASFNHIANYPTPAKPATVAVVAKPLSKMSELPVGAYYDNQREIVISGHQKGLGVGMLFGVVGVLVADAASSSLTHERASRHCRFPKTQGPPCPIPRNVSKWRSLS